MHFYDLQKNFDRIKTSGNLLICPYQEEMRRQEEHRKLEELAKQEEMKRRQIDWEIAQRVIYLLVLLSS